jgi:AraC-like DNA-binding protein
MKPLIQKLPLNENTSFVAKTFRTPNFEVGWHQHIEYELILFTEGSGMSFIGNHVGEFDTGDIYFLGSNLPHTFQKNGEQITSAVVVQSREDFWGREFLDLPELRSIKGLFETSMLGLKMQGQTRQHLVPMIKQLELATGFERVLLLGECLRVIAESKEFVKLSTQEIKSLNTKDRECIDRVFQFTIDSFRDPVTLAQVADIACMSVPAFCNYFKRRTQKTYIDFLNEIRVGYACSQLLETNETVIDICYSSGYNTMAHFHRQFLKLKGLTPLQYRKSFSSENIGKGKLIGISASQ